MTKKTDSTNVNLVAKWWFYFIMIPRSAVLITLSCFAHTAALCQPTCSNLDYREFKESYFISFDEGVFSQRPELIDMLLSVSEEIDNQRQSPPTSGTLIPRENNSIMNRIEIPSLSVVFSHPTGPSDYCQSLFGEYDLNPGIREIGYLKIIMANGHQFTIFSEDYLASCERYGVTQNGFSIRFFSISKRDNGFNLFYQGTGDNFAAANNPSNVFTLSSADYGCQSQ